MKRQVGRWAGGYSGTQACSHYKGQSTVTLVDYTSHITTHFSSEASTDSPSICCNNDRKILVISLLSPLLNLALTSTKGMLSSLASLAPSSLVTFRSRSSLLPTRTIGTASLPIESRILSLMTGNRSKEDLLLMA